MAITRSKTFAAGEILTAADLNGIESNIIDNAMSLTSPRTTLLQMGGNLLALDSDADTGIIADTNDRIDFKFPTGDFFRFDATATTPINGLDFTASEAGNAVVISAVGIDPAIDVYLLPKGGEASMQEVLRAEVFGA
jgi:hypothetical protein